MGNGAAPHRVLDALCILNAMGAVWVSDARQGRFYRLDTPAGELRVTVDGRGWVYCQFQDPARAVSELGDRFPHLNPSSGKYNYVHVGEDAEFRAGLREHLAAVCCAAPQRHWQATVTFPGMDRLILIRCSVQPTPEMIRAALRLPRPDPEAPRLTDRIHPGVTGIREITPIDLDRPVPAAVASAALAPAAPPQAARPADMGQEC